MSHSPTPTLASVLASAKLKNQKQNTWIICTILIFISMLFALYNIVSIKDYYNNLIIIKQTNLLDINNTACNFKEPYPSMHQYQEFDEKYKMIKFNNRESIEFIKLHSNSNCKPFEYGFIYNSNKNHKIAIITMFIPYSYNNKTTKLNPYHDIRTFNMRIENAIKFCIANNYDFIYFNKNIWNYTGYNIKYQQYMQATPWQKPFVINEFLDKYEWVLWVDFDTMFYDCSPNNYNHHSIENNVLKYAIDLHSKHTQNGSLISFIFAGEKWFTLMNSGTLMIKNNKWSKQILYEWMYITNNAEKYFLIEKDGKFDQKIISAILQGFDYKTMNEKQFRLYWTRFLRAFYDHHKEEYPNNTNYYYLFPVMDINISHYAVAIDKRIINENIQWILKRRGRIESGGKNTVIVHFYGAEKRDQRIWNVFGYAIQNC